MIHDVINDITTSQLHMPQTTKQHLSVIVKVIIQSCLVTVSLLNPYVTSGLAHHYHLAESTVILGASRVILNFHSIFFMKLLKANRIAPDGMPCFGASHLGLFCLHISHKKDARLIWNNVSTVSLEIILIPKMLVETLKHNTNKQNQNKISTL